MALVELNRHPSDRQLRQFAVICLAALPLLGWIWGSGPAVLGLLAALGAILAIAGVVAPVVVKPIFLTLSIVAVPIGIVIGEFALLLIYFGVFLPLGLVFRIMRRDALQLTPDRKRSTYWQTKKRPTDVSSYYRRS